MRPMSTAATTNGFGPNVTVNGHTLLSRQNGRLLLADVNDATVTASPDGRPVTDWSHVADRVDATDVKVGDFVGGGAGGFAVVETAPRQWRNFTRFETFERRPGDLAQTMTHQCRPGAQVWRLRAR